MTPPFDEPWRDQHMPAHMDLDRIDRALEPGLPEALRAMLAQGFSIMQVRGPVQMGVATCVLGNELTTVEIDAERGFSPATLSCAHYSAAYLNAAIAWTRARGADGDHRDSEYFPKMLLSFPFDDLDRWSEWKRYDNQYFAQVAMSFHELDRGLLEFVSDFTHSVVIPRRGEGRAADLVGEFNEALFRWERNGNR
jgi:hypothetical protein